jgi:hypothetical protein
MPRINDTAVVTIRQIEYSIQIKDKDTSFLELREILRTELTKFGDITRRYRPEAENPIQEYLRTNIERSIIVHGNTRIYFLDYKEKEGSLKIEFTLLVISNSDSFAQIRQSLDNVIKDTIADYFEELLERHIPINITVQANNTEIVTIGGSTTGERKPERTRRDFFTRTAAIIALVISLGLAGAYTYNMISQNSQAENAKLKEDYINLLLEKKIIEAVKDQKFTIKLYKIADTAGNTKSTVPVPKKK